MKILGISGSTKRNSTNGLILELIGNLGGERVELEIYDGLVRLPYFNPDLDNEQVCKNVVHFRESIETSDGVIICTPEYVFSLPGFLKNALEWTVSSTVFTGKPAAMIIASASGEKAYESLSLIMQTLGAEIRESSKLLIRGAKGKFSKEGQLLDDHFSNDVNSVLESLLEAISRS